MAKILLVIIIAFVGKSIEVCNALSLRQITQYGFLTIVRNSTINWIKLAELTYAAFAQQNQNNFH
jgi:hypothetical protein